MQPYGLVILTKNLEWPKRYSIHKGKDETMVELGNHVRSLSSIG